jgi:hypothetical protein
MTEFNKLDSVIVLHYPLFYQTQEITQGEWAKNKLIIGKYYYIIYENFLQQNFDIK